MWPGLFDAYCYISKVDSGSGFQTTFLFCSLLEAEKLFLSDRRYLYALGLIFVRKNFASEEWNSFVNVCKRPYGVYWQLT